MAKFAIVLCTLLIVFSAPHPTISAEVDDNSSSTINSTDQNVVINREQHNQDSTEVKGIVNILSRLIAAIRDLPSNSECRLSNAARLADIYNRIDKYITKCSADILQGDTPGQNGFPYSLIVKSLNGLIVQLKSNKITCFRVDVPGQKIPSTGGTSVVQTIIDPVNTAVKDIENLFAKFVLRVQQSCAQSAEEIFGKELEKLEKDILRCDKESNESKESGDKHSSYS